MKNTVHGVADDCTNIGCSGSALRYCKSCLVVVCVLCALPPNKNLLPFGCRSNVVVGIRCLKSQSRNKNKGIFLLSFQTTMRWFQIDLPTANLCPRRGFTPTQPRALNATKYFFFCHNVCNSTHTIAPISRKNALACQRHHPSSWSVSAVSPSFSAPNHSSKCYHFISRLEK